MADDEVPVPEVSPPQVPLEDVARYPLPGMVHPTSAAFSPDGRFVTLLHTPDRSLRRNLVAHDLVTGEVSVLVGAEGGATEGNLSLEEKLRRERQRELAVGVTRYAWARDADRLVVPGPEGVEVIDGVGEGAGRRTLLSGLGRPVLDPRLSPDGSLLAFVLDDEVHAMPADGRAAPRQITTGADDEGRSNGLAEFVAQEELDRAEGFWWSPDGARIAFAAVDERHIPVYRIVHQGSDAVGDAAQEDHRYPFAGAANARVRLGVAAVPSFASEDGAAEAPVWADLPGLDDGYLARVGWFADGDLAVQVLDRPQQRLDLYRVDPATGASTVVLTESSDVWVNVHDAFRSLPDGRFLWASERSGFRHLEVRAADGGLVATLTSGPWMVDAVAAVDADAGTVWCTGTLDGPTERHLYAVALDGGGVPRRLTPPGGTHAVVVDHRTGRFVDTAHDLRHPPTVTLRSLDDGAALRTLFDDPDPRVAELGLVPPEITTVTTRDGVDLFAAVYRPAGAGPFPTVVAVYGGPHAQLVTDSWLRTVNLRAQHLRALGYLVISVDNRGSWGRGLAFEGAVRGDLGNLEVRDQVDGVRHFVDRGLADPDRVGIYGWSYGGYMAAMCLARAPEVFGVAVAGAPVTSWDGYDTCYTERYLGTPAENPEGYTESSVMHHVEGISGQLMLVHGLIDENVHFRHTARLLNALVAARTPSELLVFPDERHVPRAEGDRVFMEQRVVGFLRQHV